MVKEVATAVHEHIEARTAAAVDGLWMKGQKALQQMEQQQLAQTRELEGALSSCAATQRRLEQENEMLRQALGTLTLRLQAVLGPQLTGLEPMPSADPAQALEAEAAARGVPAGPSAGTRAPHSPHRRPESPRAAPQTPTPQPSTPPPKFLLTIRRAHEVPLGLDVASDADVALLVNHVRPGGAVEAWNRQCAGDREIRPGDRIVSVNGVEDAEGMWQQCCEKFLLRLAVLRCASDASTATPGSAQSSLAQSPLSPGLRADADEFVPGGASAWTPTKLTSSLC